VTRVDTAALARVDAARASDGSAPGGEVPTDLAALLPPACADPQVSVLVACHDDGRYLLDALASLRLCADEHLEVIVADDASTDPFTRAVLRQIADAGVTVVPVQGRGPSAARNAALAKASTAVVLPLDADNLLRPGFVPAALAALEADASCAVVHADAMRFGQEQSHWVAATPEVADLLCGNQLDTCAVIRRSAIESVGGWDEAIVGSEDWALWVALLDGGHGFATVPIVGWDYRVRAGSLRTTLSPTVVRRHFMHLVETHPRIYAQHVVAVLANLSGALASFDEGGDTSSERRLLDRIASLDAEVVEQKRFAVIARRVAAASERDAADAGKRAGEAEARAADAEARAAAAEADAAAARHHLAVFQQTKLVQWTAGPRRLYGRVRSVFDRR
jgi:glycosyltransferase involved in cell wall biosynthesis